MKVTRRHFLRLAAGAAVLPAAPHFALAQGSPTSSQHVRVATGLLATWQSTAWLGAEAGLFKKRGIDLTLPAIAVGGPEAAAGLVHHEHPRLSTERACDFRVSAVLLAFDSDALHAEAGGDGKRLEPARGLAVESVLAADPEAVACGAGEQYHDHHAPGATAAIERLLRS